MAYETWLKRKEWQKRRLYIFERDNFKCQCTTCKTPDSILEVHHLEYLSYDLKPWEYPDDMLITLCSVCHSKENTRIKSEESFLVTIYLFILKDSKKIITNLFGFKAKMIYLVCN